MQILERSSLGVRAVIARLVHPEHRPQFELFPMVHIAEQSFYDEVRSRLDECDLVLYEGVNTLRVRLLTLSYRLVARRGRLGLVSQQTALPRAELEPRLVHADITAPDFDRLWSKVPLYLRLAFIIGAPFYGLHGYLLATRRSIAQNLDQTDLRERDDELQWEGDLESVEDLLLTSRDQRLLAGVIRCFRENRDRGLRIGVLYGAAHIPAVLALLRGKLGYRVEQADWVTVFGL